MSSYFKVFNTISKALKGNKSKVSPDIKSVKPFTDKKFDNFGFTKAKTPEDRANIVRRRASIKRMDEVDNLKKKRKDGIKASKDLKKMVDTGRAEKTGKTIYHKSIPEKKANGGRIGRRFGGDTMPRKKTNIQKIKETFGPKKNLSSKQMKIAKLAGNPNKIDGADFKKLRNK